jgi:nucleoside-diphosphate-sugar epimerase
MIVIRTGATGYIGGDILHTFQESHPDWEYAALVRSKEKGKPVKDAYPKVRLVFGDLDKYEVLKDEAAKADIVIRKYIYSVAKLPPNSYIDTADASDHAGAAKAIAEGILSGHSPDKPGYWLHTSGTGILTFADSKAGRYGEYSDKVYDDLDAVSELTSLPDDAFHRDVDKIVLEAGIEHSDIVKTAVICPPTIYGKGRGPVGTRSRQLPALTKKTLQMKKAPIIGQGKSVWNHVHVHDLSNLYVLLAEAAVAGKNDRGLWGAEGYYLAEGGEHIWGDLAILVAQTAAKKGYIPNAATEKMNKEEALQTAGFESLSWGMNSRGKARRGTKLLGWKPQAASLAEEVPRIVDSEWQLLQENEST